MVMGIVWTGLLLLALGAGLWNGSAGTLAGAAMEGAASAVTLGLSLAGSLCLWSGLTKVMEVSGITRGLARLMRPIFRRLFPNASRDEQALGYLSANVTANLLGLGNAATPMGIAAVQRMQALAGGSRATDEMCLLIVINTASIQLLPTTVAAVRASLGAASAFDILPAVWLSSICSVTAGILAAKLLARRKGHG
ncbi:MAG: spore maturation protein A [Oscillospiraceae bacterium]|nr:spore maturation protein A [Oscillospiraceae bacterium]